MVETGHTGVVENADRDKGQTGPKPYEMRRLSYAGTFKNPAKAGSIRVIEWLFWTALGGRTEVIERGEAGLFPAAARASRVTVGHAEGMPMAFANIYRDLAEVIGARKAGRPVDPAVDLCPRVEDGLRSVAAIFAVADSARSGGAGVDARPPMLR